jgi:predicted Zn-dependent peptidase
VLGLEDTGGRLGRLGSQMSALGELVPVEEDLRRLAEVTPGDVQRVLEDVLGGLRSVAVVGPLRPDLERALAALGSGVAG